MRTVARALMPVLLIFSLFLLFRGHNQPGGGFAGGLLAGAAITLYMLAFRVEDARSVLRVSPHILIGAGLLIALASAFVAPLLGRPFMTGVWTTLPGIGAKVGTPLIFDIGVYLVVLGIVVLMEMAVAEREEEEHR